MENKLFECILDGLNVSRPKAQKRTLSDEKKSPFKKNTFLDLSSQRLYEFKASQYSHLADIRYLYLKNNQLQSLDPDTFRVFPHLVWLDLRNNDISSFPASVVNAPNLTTILLENNNLQELPVEIGSLKYLKSILLRGNPLLSPLREIIETGPKKTTEYLKNEWYKYKGIEPPSDDQGKDKDRRNSLSNMRKKLSRGDAIESFDSVGTMWSDEIRVAMEQQEKYIQKKRDVEALKEWRKRYASMPKLGSKDSVSAPYDLDDRYLKVMSRSDLKKSNSRSPTRVRQHKIERSVDEDINDIQKSLFEIKTTSFKLPQSADDLEKIKFAKTKEIHKLRELQKRLEDMRMKH